MPILPPLLPVQDCDFFMVQTAEGLRNFLGKVNDVVCVLGTFPAIGKDTFWQNYNHRGRLAYPPSRSLAKKFQHSYTTQVATI